VNQEWTGEGLIFKVGRFRENDCWVRFFSPALGLVTAMAFGGSKSRRRFCGCLDALNRVLFKVRFFPVKGYYNLEEGTLLQVFPRLRDDPQRTGLAANCLNFIQGLQIAPQEAAAVHGLLLETLEVLDQVEDVSPVFLQLFRARICFGQGFAPQLGRCAVCGRTYPVHAADNRLILALDQGHVACPGCVSYSKHNVEIGPEAQSILASLMCIGPRQWARMSVSASTRGEIFQVADGYVQYHLGLRWSQGRFVPV
jgi:DNA repair protein RecO (recombination protein O)